MQKGEKMKCPKTIITRGKNTNQKKAKHYKTKIITSGNKIEVYKHEKPVAYGYKNGNKLDIKKEHEDTQHHGTRKLSDKDYNDIPLMLIRKEKRFRQKGNEMARIIEANICETSKLATLTYANEHYTDCYDDVPTDFNLFVKRMNYKLKEMDFEKMKYVTKIERGTKHNRLHIHFVYFNYPPLLPEEIVKQTWGKGIIEIKHIENIDSATNIGLYFGKYFTKIDDEHFKFQNFLIETYNKKTYFKSQNLIESKVTLLEDEFPDEGLENTIFENQYYSKQRVLQEEYLSEEAVKSVMQLYDDEEKYDIQYYKKSKPDGKEIHYLKIYERNKINYYVMRSDLEPEEIKQRQEKYLNKKN